jgi:hypothetical protein
LSREKGRKRHEPSFLGDVQVLIKRLTLADPNILPFHFISIEKRKFMCEKAKFGKFHLKAYHM